MTTLTLDRPTRRDSPRLVNALAATRCAAAAALIGTMVAVTPWLAGLPVCGTQAVRYLLGGAILLAVMRARRLPLLVPTRTEAARVTGIAATGMAGFNVCLVEAGRRADAGAIGAIVGTSPLLVALVAPMLRGHRPSGPAVRAAVLVVIGVAVVEGGGQASLTGAAYATGALIGEALFSLLAVPLLPRLGPLRISAYGCFAASAMLALGAFVSSGPAVAMPTGKGLVALAYCAVIATALAFLLWYSGLARLGPERAGLFIGLVPIASLVVGALAGTARLTLVTAAGSALVAAGLIAGTRRTG